MAWLVQGGTGVLGVHGYVQRGAGIDSQVLDMKGTDGFAYIGKGEELT